MERTYGWLMSHCRPARGYETRPHRSEALIQLAMTELMTRRLTGENTVSQRLSHRLRKPDCAYQTAPPTRNHQTCGPSAPVLDSSLTVYTCP
ncbi:hypothetical protein GCM10017557_33160 [Streptomyces aurantiacus]|uniref:Transposase n=1 Tax=Streptomyces aurantiacus TaxID=47760 RepID=A0A7G1P3R4_9ACTN|nr:hypothetical protein GCM10017557_33160 [Streptomyces aurantiacus]